MRDTLMHTAEGLLAGLVGTKVMGLELGASGRLPARLQPTQTTDHPGKFVAGRVARRLGKQPSDEQLDKAANALHWAYGTTWAALLGAFSTRLSLRSFGRALLAGAGLGAAVWLAGYAGWLPATRLAPPVHRQGGGHIATDLLMHVGYGIATALPLYGLQKLECSLPRGRS